MQCGYDIFNFKKSYSIDCDMAEVGKINQVILTAQCLSNVMKVLLG